MRSKIIITTLSIILIITCLFAACGADANQSIFPEKENESPSIPSISTNAAIQELETRIEALLNSQHSSSEEYSKELAALRAELAILKSQNNSKDTTSETPDTESESSDTTPIISTPRFLYSTDGGNATITGYTGADPHVVIPSAIDGYTVTTIAESSFSSEKLKSVIITNGITRIDWFAFEGCTSLESITIPSSVSSIGYSAFASAPTSLTIYCHSGSFAQNYAKSYGLSYAII